jgi:uncharacterized phage protein gp47/JayE
MAGLTSEGFIALTHNEIKDRIKARLNVVNPGFDFSPESPDGQNVEIWSLELAQLWSQLALVYTSGDPKTATGQGLRNIGFMSGILMSNADRSYATIGLVGTAGTVVPVGSEVSDADGNVFVVEFDAVIPANVNAFAAVAGKITVIAGTLINIVTPITGWNSITQATDGVIGTNPETEQHFRNNRNRSVMVSSESVTDALQGKLIALGVSQVSIVNNDGEVVAADGTPVGSIHVTIPDTLVSDQDIADTIRRYKSLGTPTFGTTSVVSIDSQGHSHTIKFSKSVVVNVEISMNITFLSSDISGAEDNIKADLVDYVNKLVTGEDVIWSRMFGIITPYGKAQINSLSIGELGGALSSANLVVPDTEFAHIVSTDIAITVA